MKISDLKEESILDAYQNFDKEERKKVIDDNWSLIERYIKNKSYIYRGMYSHEFLMIANGNAMSRKSANTKNYYTLLMTTFPEWKTFPDRSKSFICATETGNAGNYGNVYVAIPMEGQEIGVCPMFDFWDSFMTTLDKFDDGFEGLSDINEMVSNIWDEAREQKLVSGNLSNGDAATLTKQLDLLSKAVNTKGFESMYSDFEIYPSIKKKGFVALYKYILNPKKNGFKVAKSPKALARLEEDREVWMSGTVMFIPLDYFERLVEYVFDEG